MAESGGDSSSVDDDTLFEFEFDSRSFVRVESMTSPFKLTLNMLPNT